MSIKNQHIEDAKKTLRYWQITSAALLVSLAGVAFHAYVYWDHESSHLEQQSERYPLIDPARHLISQEHFISTLQPLCERVHALVDAEKDLNISVYIEFLNTGANISVNAEERFWPASLSKVPLAMAAMGAIESGVWSLDQVLTLEESDKMEVSSSIYTNPVGTRFTIRELLEELLVRSDNTAYRILGRNIPESELSAVKEGLGLENLFDAEGEVTAREYSRLFRALYTASYLNRKSSHYVLELLDKSEWKKYLRASVPETLPFPHKYGTAAERHTYSDSGIVYVPNRPYLITVMIETDGTSDGLNEAQHVSQVMNALSQAAYAFFTTAKNREL